MLGCIGVGCVLGWGCGCGQGKVECDINDHSTVQRLKNLSMLISGITTHACVK